jgi:hypothetical protein
MSYRAYHDHDDDRVYALGVGSGGAGESDIPFCLSGVQGVAVQDALAEAELTELFEVFSSITRRGRGLTKGGVNGADQHC